MNQRHINLLKIIKSFGKKNNDIGLLNDNEIIQIWEKAPDSFIKISGPVLKPLKEYYLKAIENSGFPHEMKIAQEIYDYWYKFYIGIIKEQRMNQANKSKVTSSQDQHKPNKTPTNYGRQMNEQKSHLEVNVVEAPEMTSASKSHVVENSNKAVKDTQAIEKKEPPLNIPAPTSIQLAPNQAPNLRPTQNKPVEPIIKPLQISIKNGNVGQEYDHQISINEDSIDNDKEIEYSILGLPPVGGLMFDSKTRSITGTPEKAGEYIIHIIRRNNSTGDKREADFKFIINPDPRSLWKVLEPEDMTDYKKHEDCQRIDLKTRRIIAASKRGRSHEHAAKYRDDDFYIDSLNTGWSIIAVGDGAGSAELSRVGSKIACDAVVSIIRDKLNELNGKVFEDKLIKYIKTGKDEPIRLDLYNIIGSAAFEAAKKIKQEARDRNYIPQKGSPEDAFATTLLIAIHKEFDVGHFFAGFWIGDGGLAIYNENDSVNLLGIPDSGEFGGQTRFLTTPNIITNNEELSKRIRFALVDNFTALFVITDGVTDPKFETDNNLINIDYWNNLWKELIDPKQADILSDEEPEKKLLNWLNFWSPGNHDDRTIAIYY